MKSIFSTILAKSVEKVKKGKKVMNANQDNLYLSTSDMPVLKEKLKKAQELSQELASTLKDIEMYNLKFEIKKEEI